MKFSDFLKPDTWAVLLGNDFNRGFMAALVLILFFILILLFIRLTLTMIFRRHRTSKIIISRPDGDTQISITAITTFVHNELQNFPALDCSRVLLFKQGKKYSLSICCSYSLNDQTGVPSFCDEFKPKLLAALKKTFGVEELDEIRLCIDEATGVQESGRKSISEPVVTDVHTGI